VSSLKKSVLNSLSVCPFLIRSDHMSEPQSSSIFVYQDFSSSSEELFQNQCCRTVRNLISSDKRVRQLPAILIKHDTHPHVMFWFNKNYRNKTSQFLKTSGIRGEGGGVNITKNLSVMSL